MVNSQLGMVLRHLCDLTAAKGTECASDTELLRRFCAGREESAFAALMQRHSRMVWGVCRDVLRHEQDAEDAFQATFLALARQASSIRKGEAVAGWLHGVARRIALAALRARAARRVHERQARSMPPEKPLSEEALREALGMLDHEVQALPERQRAVFVLCCLEGKSRTEAAHALGWKEGTVASTLARARQLLNQRLARRGVTLTSALCAVVLVRQAPAAAPAILAPATVRAALSYAAGNGLPDTVSPMVVELAKGATTTMMTIKRTAALVVLLALGLGATGLSALAPPAEPSQRPAKPPADQARARPAAAEDKATESREVSGRVVGPDNKPFKGAKLFVITRDARKEGRKAKATTGADGRFKVVVAPADLKRQAKLVATAGEHGPDWVELARTAGPRELTLRLVKDDVPIQGRLLDLEGRPLAGVAVRVHSLKKPIKDGDLKLWIENAKLYARWVSAGKALGIQREEPMTSITPAALGLPALVKTGKDGTFRLTGFGRERVVGLAIREKNLEYADLSVLTTRIKLGKEPMAAPPIVEPNGTVWGRRPNHAYGPRFNHLAGPSRPIVGTVRDKHTGKALAGVLVRCTYQDGHADDLALWQFVPWAQAATNDKGQYRIAGLGKHDRYSLNFGAIPPYFERPGRHVSEAPGLEPLKVDHELEDKGIVVRGHLTDKVTGKPVRGRVAYEALHNNPNFKDFGLPFVGQPDGCGTVKADGSFTVVARPGPGLLFVQAPDQYCRSQVGVDDQLRRDLVAIQPNFTPAMWWAVVRINPSKKDAKSRVCNIALEPGQTRAGTVVGPDGKALTGVFAEGLAPVGQYRKLETARFTLTGLSSRTPRPVLFYYQDIEKRLSKLEWVKADKGRPLTVRLEPPGTVTGRVVDARGRPLAGLSIGVRLNEDVLVKKGIPSKGVVFLLHHSFIGGKTDAKGKFRIKGCFIPGVILRLVAYGKVLGEGGVNLPTDLSVKSGKVKDLGDLKIKDFLKRDPKKEKEQ
jgi:RNA polymerase sigma factor (sigma-70 family)